MHGGITIDVVHRTHLRIFREYYPPQLDNWFTDSWIVYAYVHVGDKVGDKGVRRVVKLTRTDNFTVAHKFERRRYRPSTAQMKYLAALTECSRLAVWTYLNATREGAKPPRPVSCRAYESLPTPTPEGAACSPRLTMVGGLEMRAQDMLDSSRKVQGYCREAGPRPALT